MILMAMGEDDPLQAVAQVQDVLEVRQDQVDPQHLDLGEGEPGVDDHGAPGELEDGHVPADLPDAPQEDQPRLVGVR